MDMLPFPTSPKVGRSCFLLEKGKVLRAKQVFFSSTGEDLSLKQHIYLEFCSFSTLKQFWLVCAFYLFQFSSSNISQFSSDLGFNIDINIIVLIGPRTCCSCNQSFCYADKTSCCDVQSLSPRRRRLSPLAGSSGGATPQRLLT